MAESRDQISSPKKFPNDSNHRWVLARKSVQYLTLLLFLLILLKTVWNGLPPNVVNIFTRLDPLLMLSHLLTRQAVQLASLLALITIMLTLVFGRAWCGWICPLGTILELFSFKRKNKSPDPPESWRKFKYGMLAAILVAALLGNLTLLIFDPITLLIRSLTVVVLPAIDQIILSVETWMYQAHLFPEAVAAMDAWLRPMWLPASPLFFQDILLFAFLFASVIGLNFITSRFWCRYICPLGGMLGLLSRVAVFRREVTEPCKGCTLCTTSCPTGTIDPKRNYSSDPAECTMCMNCLEVCPRSMTRFNKEISLAAGQDYDPGRREALVIMGGTIAAVALFKSDQLAKREPNFLIRPPGVRENNPDVIGLTRCIRCSECMRVCPTNAIQPSVAQAGVQGFGSPVIIPRIGYCDYACNACGQICPVRAIPPLSLIDKQQQVIGKAYIDENRCIAWSDHKECLVCEEMCPLPEKAIQLEESLVWSVDNQEVNVKLPQVLRERCIGCGICEYKCPLNGDAAIRIYVPQTAVPF